MRLLFALIALCFSLFGADYYEEDLDVQEAFTMMKKGAVIVDVRTPGEYIYAGHIPGAVSLPLFDYRYAPKSIKVRMGLAKMEQKSRIDPQKAYSITPVENQEFLEDARKLRKLTHNAPLLIICRSGVRSRYAANLLAKNGFTDIYNVDGGFLAWKRAKLPVWIDR